MCPGTLGNPKRNCRPARKHSRSFGELSTLRARGFVSIADEYDPAQESTFNSPAVAKQMLKPMHTSTLQEPLTPGPARILLNRRRVSARHLWGVLLALQTLAASGCSDAEEPQGAPASETAATLNHQTLKWLEINSHITPEQWLASRHEPALRPADDPEVQRIRVLLQDAHRLYRESTRMIANRAVQVEVALKEHGAEDTAVALLTDISTLAGEVGQTEGFGAICHHYLNMRVNGLDRSTVIATLKDRYGKRR